MPILQRFMLFLKTQDDCGFIESLVACFAAPVVSGLKCGVLLNLYRSGRNMLRPWGLVKDDISNRLSVKFAEISSNGFSLLVFIYRTEALGKALSSEGARSLLEELGYGENLCSVDSCVGEVVRRSRGGIQHEIGIFLGYPPEDVRGFMENHGRNSKLSGYWKVYGDVVCALKKFEEYKMAETVSARNLLAKAGFQEESSSSAVHV